MAQVLLSDFWGCVIKRIAFVLFSQSLNLLFLLKSAIMLWEHSNKPVERPMHGQATWKGASLPARWVSHLESKSFCLSQNFRWFQTPVFKSFSWDPRKCEETNDPCYTLFEYLTHRNYEIIKNYCYSKLLSFGWFIMQQ